MIANPHKKTTPVRVRVDPPKPAVPRCGTAQAAFITKARKAMSLDPTVLHDVDWRRVSASASFLSLTKKTEVDSFYVKDLAVWLPHVVMPGHIPTCSRCLTKSGVDVGRFRWTKNRDLRMRPVLVASRTAIYGFSTITDDATALR